MKKLVLCLVALALLVWAVSLATKNRGASPAVVFEKLLGEEASSVERLEGFVFVGDGYDVHIRFRASDNLLTALPYKGFRKVSCEDTRDTIRFSPLRIAALPLWLPETIESPICFRRRGTNEWSPSGRDAILADPNGGWVYFSGEGHEHDRALPDPESSPTQN